MRDDRLISLNAAVDALNEYFSRIGKLKRRGLSNAEKAISLDTVGAIKSLPSAQPTVDAEPVVHGRWVTDGMIMDCGEYLMTRCTACGTPFEYGYDMPYCPQCGAVMDGKDGDGNC